MADTILQNDTAPSLSDYYLLQKKLEIMMEANNKRIAAELSNINQIVAKLNDGILEIKRQISNENIQKAKLEPAPVLENHREDVKINQNKADDTQISRPRYGDYKPEDVSVGKFFYFGNKK